MPDNENEKTDEQKDGEKALEAISDHENSDSTERQRAEAKLKTIGQ